MVKDLYKQKRSLELRGQLEYDQFGKYTLNMVEIDNAIKGIITEIKLEESKIAAKGMKMICPSALQFTAERLMKSTQRVGTSDNDINAVVSMGMIPQGYTVNHYLTDTDAWFIKTDVPNGLKHFVRAPIKTAMEGDFETGNVRYKARERYSFGWSDWRGIFGSPGA